MNHLSWLTLKAANGLKILYVGYTVVDIAVGGVVLPQLGVIVVQDDCMDTGCGLFGMSVIAQCWEILFQSGHPGQRTFHSSLSPFAGKVWEKAVCRM